LNLVRNLVRKLMFYMFYIVKHFDRFPIQIYDVKHNLTLSSAKKIQMQT